jgi:hypothetical protein
MRSEKVEIMPTGKLKDRTRAFALGIIAKLGIVEEEGDETLFWIDLAVDATLSTDGQAMDLRREANEIVAMVVSSIRTARGWRRVTPHSALRAPRSSCS